MAIPREIIDRILHDTDIVEIISESVQLKKTGANYKACCPFHNEKTPSFVVSPQKQIYHCFGCNAGGNVLSFIMEHEKMDFIEVIKMLAGRLNIALPKTEHAVNEDPREPLLKINSYTQWFFRDAINRAKHAQEYLEKRGLADAIIERYALGYAPDGFENLLNYLANKKIPLDLAVKLGVIKRRDDGKMYDFFRDRLMFPVRNARGQFVGFSGRTLSNKDEAKYINSPESPVYNKGREVFGLFEAKDAIKKKSQIVVVEGNVDVLACAQLGIENVVAPLGTSLTESQVRLLKRYSSDMVIMFDGDDAGQKACLRAVEIFFAAECHPKVALLPQGRDPGDFLTQTEKGPALKDYIEKATDAMDWIFSSYVSKASEQPKTKALAIKGVMSWVNKIPDSLERSEYQKKVSQYFDVESGQIQKTLEMTRESATRAPLASSGGSLEARVVALYIQQQKTFKNEEFDAILEDFSDARFQQLGIFVKNYLKKHETFDAAVAITEMPDDVRGILSELMLVIHDDSVTSSDAKECIKKLKIQANKRRLKDITAKIMQADLTQNNELKMQLLNEKQVLLKKTQELAGMNSNEMKE